MGTLEIGLEELAARCGILNVPASWAEAWPDFADWFATTGCAQSNWELPPDASHLFDLPPESLPPLKDAFARIGADDSLRLLAAFWHYLVYHLPQEIGDNSNDWPMPESLAGIPLRVFTLAVIVSGTRHAEENFRSTKVADDIIAATLGYIGRYVRDVHDKRGVFGLESMTWLRNYVRADIFRLGRLTFRNSEYLWPYRVFQHRSTRRVVALCEPPTRYRRDGLADGTNATFDPQAWTPVLDLLDDGTRGCPVDEDRCIAIRQPVWLPAADWECVLASGDRRVEVHIAGGSRMPPDECRDAYRQARAFFPRQYPATPFAAFTCWSWLLDPALKQMLPAASNIAAFQRDYHLLPVLGNSDQAYDLVYGSRSADPRKMPQDTQLRRAIAQHVAAGGQMRSAAGIMLWQEALGA